MIRNNVAVLFLLENRSFVMRTDVFKRYLAFCMKNCRELPVFQNITESLEREGISLMQGFLKRLSSRAIHLHFGTLHMEQSAATTYWQRLSTAQWLA